MKRFCIACGVFRKDLEDLLPGMNDAPEVRYLEGGLHADPPLLKRELQKAIDEVPRDVDRIILLYGVCGKGIIGLKSEYQSIVIPRVHDCISLFLGGGREYKKQFSHVPGSYYISRGWYEEQVQPRGRDSRKKKHPHHSSEYVDTLDQNVLTERFGEENSRAVTEFFDSWKTNYSRAVYIDTGGEEQDKYESYARSLADENNWNYTRLSGSRRLIQRCFEDEPVSDDEILVVPQGREIVFDPAADLISFSTAYQKNDKPRILEFNDDSIGGNNPDRSLGLGIDAGGTYTDAVLFDFNTREVLARAKSPTTKWKYSEGIINAVKQLPEEGRNRVDLVSLSTTLVTNAIVESNIHPVGLLLMPLGNDSAETMSHSPTAVVKGRMNIEGEITEDIDPEEIADTARLFVKRHGVRAFAVSGYGASVNPELELRVKEILRDTTGLDVCCGHELSGTLNFYVRAHTAVLNAGVIPIMEEFLQEMKTALNELSVHAPQLVVKGDGSVMTGAFASEFPVQTALCGPAASMAGARYLTELEDALVIDVGGTTSDIGFLEKGLVSVCDEGASIGSWRTHVKAVDMQTTGLGGDSAIIFDRQLWHIGPGRITPFCALNAQYSLASHLQSNEGLSGNPSQLLHWLYLTGKEPEFTLNSQETQLMELLKDGPMLIRDIAAGLSHGVWKLLKTERLEKSYCIQRAGLTPTDLYHLQGKMDLWDAPDLKRYFELTLDLQKESSDAVIERLEKQIAGILGKTILQSLFPDASDDECFASNVLGRGNARMSLTPGLQIPVIGLGAPAFLILEDAVRQLGGKLLLPENGDVANAVGAVTSEVSVGCEAHIVPNQAGLFSVQGFDSVSERESLEEAEKLCLDLLVERTRKIARQAGTSATGVRVMVEDKTAEAAGGELLFLERRFRAVLKGAPDLV